LTAAQAQQVLDVLRDDARRTQFLSVLESMARALPATSPAPAAGHPAGAPPAAAPAAAPGLSASASIKLGIPLTPNSLGAEVLVGASERLSRLSAQLADMARALTDFPLFSRWLMHLAANPDARQEVLETAWKLALVVAGGLLVETLATRLLRRLARALSAMAPDNSGNTPAVPPTEEGTAEAEAGQTERLHRNPSAWTMLRRLPYVLGRFLLDLLPILAMAAVGYALLGTALGTPSTTRLVILAMLNAYILCRIVITVTRLLVAPDSPRLRLVHLSDEGAGYILRWVRRIVILAVFGYAIAEVALLFGLYRVAHDALLKMVSLAVHMSLVVVVLQKRRPVAELIAGKPDATGAVAVVRRRAARVWHVVAIFYLVALWLVWAFEVQDGFARLIRIFISTVVISIAARLLNVVATGVVDRALRVDATLAARYPGLDIRARRYHPVARATVTGIIAAFAAVALFEAWGLDSLSWFTEGALGGRVVSAVVTIGVTLIVSLLAWELANAGVQRELARLTRDSQAARAARLRTLLPMFRSTLLVTILIVAALMVLSEVGVNIAPLLAGAGVLGIAIGFGSQSLVRDVITGLFLLLENTMQVGDIVSLGGLTGTVEALSVRAIRLRAEDGSVHVIPFSAVTTVTNMTRDFGHAVIEVGVAYKEDYDHVIAVMRAIVDEMRKEPRWEGEIRNELEVMGLNAFGDSAVTIKALIKCGPFGRWSVRREFNRRMKQRFEAEGIEIPFPHQTLVLDQPIAIANRPAPSLSQVQPIQSEQPMTSQPQVAAR
jgi:small-conductance mechanosensitive channel